MSTAASRVTPDQAVDVGGGGRAEGAQVAAHDLRRVGLGERAAEPAVDVLVDHAARLLPGAARRQLGERLVDPGQLAERVGRDVGEPGGQRLAERLHRQRPVGEGLGDRGVHLVGVEVRAPAWCSG